MKDNTIRVGELIDCLSKMPKDAPVYFCDDPEDGDTYKVNGITLKSDCFAGDAELDTYVVVSYDDDVDEYEERKNK